MIVTSPATTPVPILDERQLWNPGLSTSSIPCPPITLVAGGNLIFGSSNIEPLTQPVVYYSNQECLPPDPFYASTIVFIYVLGTCTVIAWILFILLLIAQRTFHPARPTTIGTGWISGRGLTTAIAGRTPLGGLGARPWLQKVAAFLVSAGLTVASIDAFREASRQHDAGITDATQMRYSVSDTEEVRIMRIISGVFIWLAQVQTLIRLFPRRKEKLIIKWLGFTLILLDLVFSCLDSFLGYAQYSRNSPRYYQDAIPALSYLFQLAISLLYLAWVLYYVITQRRYAFFRPDQLSISIVALLALVSIAIPVGFFVADISVPVVAGWGDFFRWVGSCAASIVVWEWVERIEATEREEKRDGILGRELFEEDEQHLSDGRSRGSAYSGSDGSRARKTFSNHRMGVFKRFPKRTKLEDTESPNPVKDKKPRTILWKKGDPKIITRPESTSGNAQNGRPIGRKLTPPSRTDTTSAGSTVYAVHYHPITITPPIAEHFAAPVDSRERPQEGIDVVEPHLGNMSRHQKSDAQKPGLAWLVPSLVPGWSIAAQALKKRKRSPPVEIKQALSLNEIVAPTVDRGVGARFDLRNRIAGLWPGVASNSSSSHLDNPVQQPTIIPAPPRGLTWSPEARRHSPVNPLHRGSNTTLQVHPALQQYSQHHPLSEDDAGSYSVRSLEDLTGSHHGDEAGVGTISDAEIHQDVMLESHEQASAPGGNDDIDQVNRSGNTPDSD